MGSYFSKFFSKYLCKFLQGIGIALLVFPLNTLYAEGVELCSAHHYAEALAETNRIRSSLGLTILYRDSQLDKSAELRALQIAKSQVLSHDGYLDSFVRVGFEYKYHFTSEILAKGYKTGRDAVQGWYKSKSHRRSLKKKEYNYLGIGCAVDSTGTIWWVEHFKS